jgi:hypothetical protein
LRIVHQHNGLAVMRYLYHAGQQAVRQHFASVVRFSGCPCRR